eukprot:TRINITY_DN90019_c0_g1_i1.p1 TRINITY_DN90019_c0_g1~~TRINITY_DN90019_c0_g1_i1.p1  ORF type:complete len:184 (+),score=32.01 TRINITY_DN90019_c0_g1_i1:224-775(+)
MPDISVGECPPKLVVFDLDACCWYPEMYMISDGGDFICQSDPRCARGRGGKGAEVRLLGAVPEIWSALAVREDVRVGIASRCDVPEWAEELLKLFRVPGGRSMWDIAEDGHLVEIYRSSKQRHLQALAKKTGIALQDMLFFDDDPSNIRDVQRLGVTSILTPDGVTEAKWQEGLAAFARRSRQ